MIRLVKRFTFLAAVFFCSTAFAGCKACNDYTEILQEHLQKLQFLEVEQPPLVITFSAGPGMGKSTVSRLLEEELQGLRISTNDVREMLAERGYQPDALGPKTVYTPLEVYLMFAMSHMHQELKNHCVILDTSIDRNFAKIAGLAANFGYPVFVIRLDCPREVAAQRLQDSEAYPAHMEHYYDDYDNFDCEKVSYYLDNSGDVSDLAMDDLVEKIREFWTGS